MKMYSVKDGELECREVDVDFFKKNTTLGGLLSSDVIELDLDNKMISGSVGTNKMPHQLTLNDLDNVKIHENICKELNNIYKKKNADYGNSFENSLDKHGLIAGIVRMDDKMSRLISLNSKNEQMVLDESLRDTLMDLANYAIMSVMWLDEQ